MNWAAWFSWNETVKWMTYYITRSHSVPWILCPRDVISLCIAAIHSFIHPFAHVRHISQDTQCKIQKNPNQNKYQLNRKQIEWIRTQSICFGPMTKTEIKGFPFSRQNLMQAWPFRPKAGRHTHTTPFDCIGRFTKYFRFVWFLHCFCVVVFSTVFRFAWVLLVLLGFFLVPLMLAKSFALICRCFSIEFYDI